MEDDKINPTMLAKDCGIRTTRPGEGDGRLLNWDGFWDLVEQAYWRNRTQRMDGDGFLQEEARRSAS